MTDKNPEQDAIPEVDYHQSLPVWDSDADSAAGAPVLAPDGSEWEPEDSAADWEDKFVADPEAAREATRERMNAQAEQDKAAAAEAPPAPGS